MNVYLVCMVGKVCLNFEWKLPLKGYQPQLQLLYHIIQKVKPLLPGLFN